MNVIESTLGGRPRRYLLEPSETAIPLWVRFKSRVQSVARSKATHYLLDVLPVTEADSFTTSIAAHVALRRNGYSAKGVLARLSPEYYGFYVDSAESVVYSGSVAKRLASVAYSQVSKFVWNTPTVMDTLQNLFQSDKLTRPRKFAPPPEYVRSKISSEHHTHLRPSEVLAAARETSNIRYYYARVMVERLRAAQVDIEATVSTFLVYSITASSELIELVLDSKELWEGTKGLEALAAKLKEVSGQIKSINTSDYEPLTELFEMLVLVNRGVGEVNWHKERANRTEPNLVNIPVSKAYVSARKMFANARLSYKYPKMDIDEYLDRRWEWVPGGSVHSQYEEDSQYIIPGQYSRNKFVTLNLMPKHAIRKFLGSRPEIRAWPSTKYEWGKQRAIYGTDLRSTVITNFAMFKCEDVLSSIFPVGSEAEAGKVHKRIQMMLDHSDSFCFDYDDFNSQHSIEVMHAVLRAFADEYRSDMSSEQRDAMAWVVESVKRMLVLDREKDEWYELRGTLLSGWRLTTFINTVLNWVYMDVAGVFDLDDVSDSVHNGDDVMIALTAPKTAIAIMDKMQAINARAQVTKCNLFTVAEFLRVEHGAIGAEGLGAQYLTRSCATLTHSRIESREPVSVMRLVEADQDRLRDLRARTQVSKAADALEEALDRRVTKIFSVDMNTVKAIKKAHRVCGGVNSSRWAPIDMQIVKRTGAVTTPAEIDDPSSWPGVYDYAAKIEAMFGKTVPFRAILGAVIQGSRATIAMSKTESVKVIKVDDLLAKEWERAMYKTYAGISTTYYTSMSKFVSIPPISNLEVGEAKYFVSAVQASSDKLRAMQILI